MGALFWFYYCMSRTLITTTVSYMVVPLLSKSCVLCLFLCHLSISGKHQSLYCVHSFPFSKMSSGWNHVVCSLFRLTSFTLLMFRLPVISDSLWLCGQQRTSLPCPSSPRACSNSRPLSQWCHPIISSYVVPFSCLQSFPASGSFQMSQIFTSGGQSSGV